MNTNPAIVLAAAARSAAPAPARDAVLKNTLASVVALFTHLPEWAGVIALSELDQRIVFRRSPPFADSDLKGQPVRERDMDCARHWFEEALGLVLTKANVVDAFRIVAGRNSFHPVRDYLGPLEWDGVPRVATWLTDYAGVEPTSEDHAELLRAVGRKWLVACAARAMKPGSKVDTTLIFEGAQGIGKSTLLKTLAGEPFYCDSAIDFASKDACQTIQGVWIYELAELDALLRRDLSTVKAFLSRCHDRFRVPYGRAPEVVARSVVFAGTVNHGGYLRDKTGNRRFWTVRCTAPIDLDGLAACRDRLWAEAVLLYRKGEAWHLTRVEEARMDEERDPRVEIDPWEERIAAWTSARAETPFTMDDVLESALGLAGHRSNSRVTTRVSQILASLGFERTRRTALPRTYQYVRAAVPPSPRPT
jgi:putative DNA primase/helicase